MSRPKSRIILFFIRPRLSVEIFLAPSCQVPSFSNLPFSIPLARSLSNIAVRDEAKEMRPDARPQAWKRWRYSRWNTLRIFSGRERRRWLRIVRRSRTVNVGQAPGPSSLPLSTSQTFHGLMEIRPFLLRTDRIVQPLGLNRKKLPSHALRGRGKIQ